MGHIILDECSIPDYCLVGEENVGYPLIKPLLNEGRLDMAAVAVGISQAALDDSVSFAGRVGLYGRSLSSYQGVSFPIADMYTKTLMARNSLYTVASHDGRRNAAHAGRCCAQAVCHGKRICDVQGRLPDTWCARSERAVWR
ncbi:MAG: acyl-CoA dehydrogenase family protein [Oscillospiraceae bacterium]